MDDRQESAVFQALVQRILHDSTFAQDLLQAEDADLRKAALSEFLVAERVPEERWSQALEDLIQVLENTDLGKIDALAKTLDDFSVAIPF